MARKLPWLTGDTARSSARSIPAASRPEREPSLSPIFTSDQETTPHFNSKKASRKRRNEGRLSRTPSSSPLSGPTHTEYMHEGYGGDDIHIMVEDELQCTAQSFTRHLHHAEYLRVKKKAREGPSLDLPDLPQNVRPETKRKVEAATLQKKQDCALRQITARTDILDEDMARDDPWQNTSLADLMGTSSRPKKSLVGLERIPSSTRAANGFRRGEMNSPVKSSQPKSIMEIFGDTKRNPIVPLQEPSLLAGDVASIAPKSSLTKTTAEASQKMNASRHAGKPQLSRRNFIDFDDGFDEASILSVKSKPSLSKSNAQSHGIPEGEKKQARRSRFSEIPTFLV